MIFRSKYLKVVIVFVNAILMCGFFAIPAKANLITAKFLEIPYKPKKGDFYYGGAAPFSIEFIGAEALKAKNCFNLTSEIARDFSVKWTIADKSLARSLDLDGGFVHTIGVTKTGIQCAYLFSGGGLYDINSLREPLYKFSENESQVGLKLTLFRGTEEITSGIGVLQNPEYVPPAPVIVGLDRGDTVNSYTRFNLKNLDGSAVTLGVPSIQLCELSSRKCDLGWGKVQDDGSVILITNNTEVGKSASLNIAYSYLNSAGYDVRPSTSLLVKIGEPTEVISLEIVKQFKDIFELHSNLKCIDSGKFLSCTIEPVIKTIGTGSNDKTSIVKSALELDVFTQLDSKPRKKFKTISVVSGNSIEFSVPWPNGNWKKDWNRFQISIDNENLPKGEYLNESTWGDLPLGPKINLQFPNFVLWNQPFQISATSSKGVLRFCTFSAGGSKLGKVNARNRQVSISVTAVWNGSLGSSTYLNYAAVCNVDGKSITGYGTVRGYR